MEGFTTLDFIWDTYDISIGWMKLLNVVTTASCRRLILNMSHWTTLLWYSIPLIYHNLTEIRHGGEGWLWYEQLSPAGPITRKENSLSQFHDKNKSFSRFTKKNARKQHYKMYKMLTFDTFPTSMAFKNIKVAYWSEMVKMWWEVIFGHPKWALSNK